MDNGNELVEIVADAAAEMIALELGECGGFLAKQVARAVIPLIAEACAKIAEEQAATFMSPEYAYPQPLGSFQERFACNAVAHAIREVAGTLESKSTVDLASLASAAEGDAR